MNHTYFILHGRETAEVAKRLVTELHILGQTAATGPSLSRCDILVTLRSLSDDELRRSQDLAHLMVNISADTPEMGLLARGLAAMSAPLARVKNAQMSPSRESNSQIAIAACTAFDAVSVDVERHRFCSSRYPATSSERIGRPLSQTGQYAAAFSLFEYSTDTLIRLATHEEVDDEHIEILGTIATLLQDASVNALNEDDSENAVQTFIEAYEHVLSGLDTSYAMQNLDALVEDVMTSGRPISPTLVYDVLNVAFSHGEPLMERGSIQWVLQLYLLAAQGVLRMVGPQSGQRSLTAQTARDLLAPFEDIEFDGPVPDADAIVNQLSSHLYSIRDSARGERDWEHDS